MRMPCLRGCNSIMCVCDLSYVLHGDDLGSVWQNKNIEKNTRICKNGYFYHPERTILTGTSAIGCSWTQNSCELGSGK